MDELYNSLYLPPTDNERLTKEIRLLDDITGWVEDKINMRPWPHQVNVLEHQAPKRCRCSNLDCEQQIQRYEEPPDICPICQSEWYSINPGPKRLALRFARRTGKSMILSWIALHTALTNERATVLVIGPGESQLDQLFDDKLRPMLTTMDVKTEPDRRRPHELGFSNGSTIRGFCTARAVRGFGAKQKRADNATAGRVLMIFDEMDYMDPTMFDAAIPIILELNVDVIVSSTPSGARSHFYNLCNDVEYKEFYYSREMAANLYKEWAIENGADVDIGPAWDDDTQAALRRELTTEKWVHEVEADWGELEGGVYQEFYISMMFDSELSNYTYSMSPNLNSPCRTIGVDWNKYSVGPEIIGLEVDPILDKVVIRFRENLPPGKEGELTYSHAIDKIIQINEIFRPHWIFCDRGAGESQIEQLHIYGNIHPEGGLTDKVVGISFSDKLEYFDAITMDLTSGPIKPWMVNNLVKTMENGRIIGCRDGYSDKPIQLSDGRVVQGQFARGLRAQLSGYYVKRYADSGRPVYSADSIVSDDAHDALILALHAVMIHHFGFNRPDFTSAAFFVPMPEYERSRLKPEPEKEDNISQWGAIIPRGSWGKPRSNTLGRREPRGLPSWRGNGRRFLSR